MAPPPTAARVRPLTVPFWAEASDSELVVTSLGGNRMAQTELYRRHAPRVLGTALRLLGRQVEAEDVVQEAFLQAFRDLRQLEDGAKFPSWILGIAVHLVHRRFRRRKLLARLGLDRGQDACTLELLSTTADPETLATLAEIDRVLCRLPTEVRLAFCLRHVEGHELRAVAELCRCSLATAKRRITRAMEELSSLIEEEGEIAS